MIPMPCLLVSLFMMLSVELFAQYQGNVWVFANGNTLDFSVTPPQPITGSQIMPNDIEVEGVASISDQNGNLLFYTDGVSIWDWQHTVISNSLMGHQSSTNSAFIVPVPSAANAFYLFTLDAMQNGLDNGLRYSVVHACREEGVVMLTMNQLLSLNMTEKMTAIHHSNGHDYWLVAHEFGTDVFKVFLIDDQGISLTDSIACGLIHGPDLTAAVGQMKASPDGSKIAVNVTNNKWTDIVSFNKSTGQLACLISFPPDTSESGLFRTVYGASFSDNSRFLYLSGGSRFRLWQFDTDAISTSDQAFFSSKVTLSDDDFQSGSSFHQLQLGPDGKIYCASWNNEHLAVIHQPNLSGLNCAFEDSAIALLNLGNYGLPSFIDSYNYTSSGLCEPNVIAELNDVPLAVYPNPASQSVRVEATAISTRPNALTITDVLGQVIQNHEPRTSNHELDVSTLTPGLYTVAATMQNGAVLRQRLVVQR